MSSEGEAAVPMEEEVVPLGDSPSGDSAASMDWVKVDEATGVGEATGADELRNPPNHPPAEEAPFDEYSFGSSDDDDDSLGKLADVSLDTAFDMEILQRSIEGSEDALDVVVGKDVVMVVGKTGVGKSTLIQGIAGKKIHTSFHKSSFSGETSTKAVFDAHDALPNFEIGHAKVSKTRCLNALLRKNGENEVVYLDSPGLEDTRGVEMDIATSTLLGQVAKRCKSLRFVILIHCASLLEDRGKAFRSVAQFAKRFVEDFAESKYSFMFLFTHTNEITGMSSNSDAKKRLQEEIIQIAGATKGAATKDEDVLAVLDFVCKSLKKNYPFAGVLHPLDTDYPTLASLIEQKLRGVIDLASASSCNLTLGSKLKLESAVQNLLERMQAALRLSSPSAIAEVKDIQKKFLYLREYVEVESVRKFASQSEEVINGHKQTLSSCIESEFNRWTSPSSDFDEKNAQALNDALSHLQAFDASFSAEHWIKSKEDDLSNLQSEILMRASSCRRFHRRFKKLHAWTSYVVQDSSARIYTDTCTKIMALYEDTVDVISRADPSALHESSDEDVSLFVEKVLLLHGMCDFAEQISVPEINFQCATVNLEKILEDLRLVFLSWTNKAAELAKSNAIDFKDDLKDVASHARALESMKAVLRKHGIGINSLDKNIESALKNLENDVIGLFALCCEDIKNSGFDPEWEPKMNWMRDTCQRFSRMHSSRWKEMVSSFSAVTNKAKSVLLSASGELENMAQVTKENGMMSGERLGGELAKFKKCKWFDSYLPEGDAFVANCCIAIELAFQARINEKSEELSLTVASLGKEKDGSTESIEKLGLLLPELKEIDIFLGIAAESSGAQPPAQIHQVPKEPATSADTALLAAKCVRHLEDYTQQLSIKSKKYTGDWIANMSAENIDKLHSLAQKLEVIYADANVLDNSLQSIDVIAKSSREIIRDICSGCEKFSSLAESELGFFGGDFNLKANILTLIKACRGLSHMERLLPEYKDVQHLVRSLVAIEAQKLESEIEATSDWDTIDERIEIFKSAVVLDEYVSQEATARLNTLHRLREKKEGQVDAHLQDMIGANNFKGIAAFLAPLAESKDQIKKQKYESYQDEIAFNLGLVVEDVKRFLGQEMTDEDAIKSVAQSMSILLTARTNLQRLLHKKLNLATQIDQLKGKIDRKLKPMLDQVFESTRKKEFLQAAASDHQASLFTQHLQQHIKKTSMKRQKQANAAYTRELDNVVGYVNTFFQSSFKEKIDLRRSLDSLKDAKESNNDLFKSLVSLYDKTWKELLTRVRDFIQNVQESVSEAKCFDDVIPLLLSLKRAINGPLKAHIPTNLLLEYDNVVDRLQKEKAAYDRELEFDGKDVEQVVERWKNELDRLQSPTWYRRALRWMSNDSDKASYMNLKKKLTVKCNRVCKQALGALRSGDYRSVQENIDFLILVEKKLSKHVEMGGRLRDLRGQCADSFLGLCRQVKGMLEAKEIFRFEEKFADYRGYVLFIPCILASKECSREFSLVNQMMYEGLVQQIDSFQALADAESLDFSGLRSQLLRLRKSGDFFSDRVILLNEEIKHITSDKWLGKVHILCSKHFSNGRDFGKLKYCVDLGVVPSATESEIRKAYKEKARLYHPDKRGGSNSAGAEDAGLMFRKVKDAQDALLSSDHFTTPDRSQAFDEVLKGIGGKLRTLAKQFMEEQRYDVAEKLLFQLPSLKELDNLVVPKLKSGEIQSSVCEIIKGHVEKMRVDVDTNWAERKYKDLNDSITDLKQMESHFKSYPGIFSTSWNTGIVGKIEAEIESLGKKAGACLSSQSTAKKMEGDFRRFFVEMGSVLVELPSFKAFTKHVMSNILESCLDQAWGYSFLFELGQSLQRGDDSSDDNEKRIAQMLVSEFSHFKEVLTMCWNEETSQKPVEDVIMYIKGENRKSHQLTETLTIDQKELLESFKSYDMQYKSLLGEYIKPDADLNVLVRKISALAQKMQPITCDKAWDAKEKKSIPMLLAGVFALFTVLNSGASYNRIEAAGGSSTLGEKLLMKPHNIQVLTLLYMFGCGKGPQSSLDSQLMQIRTGEGKSMILGAAAAVLALLGFSVRTVCYSEYLSSRDFRLFEEVFQRFGLLDDVKYSKITAFAEDSTASKGNIRELTESLLRGNLLPAEFGSRGATDSKEIDTLKKARDRSSSPREVSKKKQKTRSSVAATSSSGGAQALFDTLDISAGQKSSGKEEILLVDEVDVFFGCEFYGKTYNQVIEFKEPEVATILRRIWDAHSRGSHRLRLNDIKNMSEYKTLLKKMASFGFLLDNEISLMLNQVKRVDDVPYYLDAENDRVGYKVMDSISYNVTFGYATIFAYLKEANNLKDKTSCLSRALVMPVSCGQFSYANISPARILGVSGTLEAIGQYEKDVLNTYGLNRYIYVPSVYGESNFHFDKAGEGIYFESNKSNFYHKISAEITAVTKSKRAVIVFFGDRSKLNEFVASPTYRKLGRHKSLLTEDMSSIEKEYVINKAATSGQITLSTAVFGRGTDFFCKDEGVEKNGGVHIIQTFLSEEVSEEVQIQGRTARQGKRGSYQMVLLESDLASDFGAVPAEKDKVPKSQWYDWLCRVRSVHHKEQCVLVEKNLEDATEKDTLTHQYFDSLLACNEAKSKEQFKDLYQLIKKPPVPSSVSIDLALVIDVTGSMAPYVQSAVSTIKSLLSGQNALISKLSHNFPEIGFHLRLGCLGFRDIDDRRKQFTELLLNGGSHFTNDVSGALGFVQQLCSAPSGGFDLAEDIIGAVHHCGSKWQNEDDWTGDIKFMMLFTDAASHGLLPKMSRPVNSADAYPTRHPEGLTTNDAVTSMISKDIDLFFCSFNPLATARTEDTLSEHFKAHPDNSVEHGVTRISMVPKNVVVSPSSSVLGGHGRHIIFVLDESGSMSHSWSGVVAAYNQYIAKRKQSQSDSDLVSVVQFDSQSRIAVQQQPLSAAPGTLSYQGGGTSFYPAAVDACKLARATPKSHTPAIIFMSDGCAGDAPHAAREFSSLNEQMSGGNLELHVIAFGSGTNQAQLQQIAGASRAGKVHASANTAELASVFVGIATTQNVSLVLESEIAKRISEAVSDKLSLEYFGS